MLKRFRRILPGPYPESETNAIGVAPRERPVRLTADGRLMSGRLAGLTMDKAIFVLSWPILVESFLNALVGFADTRLSSGLGVAETDAIGAASYIMWFFGLTIMAIGVGTTALVSRAVGRGRMAVANAAIGQTLLLQFLSGVLVMFGVLALIDTLADAMSLVGPDAEATREAFKTYLSITAAGVPVMGLLFGSIACIRGAGDSMRPLLIMVVVNVLNIGLSFLLSGVDISVPRTVDGELVQVTILRNPNLFGDAVGGIAGIALGTVISQAIGALLAIGLLIRGVSGARLLRKRLRPHLITIRRLVRLGVPNFIETLGMWLGNFGVIYFVGVINAWQIATSEKGAGGALGAHIIAIRAEAFSFLPGFAMGVAAATLAGQYLGAGSPAIARRAVLRCAIIGAVVMGSFGALFMLAPRFVVSIFSEQPEHLQSAPVLMVICGAVQIPFAAAIVFRQAMRGAGDVRWAMALTWFSTYGIRLPLAWALSGVDLKFGSVEINHPFFDTPSLTRLWLALCIELVIRGLLFGARFMHGGWARQKV